jgi:6 kDa early secretory antigenic target
MSEIKVNFAAVATANTDVLGTAGRINSQLEDLKRYLAPLTNGWTGQASEDYHAKQRQWDTAAADLNQVLATIGRTLGSAHEGYVAAENANASRFRA